MPSHADPAPTSAGFVLIVEEDAAVAGRLGRSLEEHGFPVRHAADGAGAEAVLGSGEPPLAVVCEVHQPGIDGPGLCRLIRREPRFARVGVVLLTSRSDPADVLGALECGADYLFPKPCDEGMLIARLRRIGADPRPFPAAGAGTGSGLASLPGAETDPRHALNLLLSIHEAAVVQNRRLERAEAELRELNASLEDRVRERAAELRAANAALHAGDEARLRGEERLREQAELLDKAGEAIVTADARFRVRFWNRAAARLLQREPAELEGRRLQEVLAAGELTDAGSLAAALAAGNAWRGEIRVGRRAGSPLVLEAGATILRDAAGRADGWLIIGSDVSERKLLEEKFLRAQRLESIGMLAAGISHDLNNVLAPIGMAASLLRMRLSSAPDLRLIDTLEKSVGRGAGLVKQILGFAQGVGGERNSLQVKHLLRDITSVITQTFPKSIELEDHVPTDLWPVRGNATQIHQVLLNLCVNARDAMPGGGRLRVRGENRRLDAAAARALPGARPGAWVVLEVGDTGSGIPPEVVERIWEPFFTTKAAGRGTGLGLSTVRGIVQTHEGFVSLETAVGRGTTFRVHLPAVDVPEEVPAGAKGRPAAAGRGRLVLIADDEDSIREITGTVLTNAGFAVEKAADGLAAAALYAERPGAFSLLITDHDMPGLDGEKLAAFVRSRHAGTRILAVSGFAEGGSGGGDVPPQFGDARLAKPFTAAALLDRVGELLGEAPP